MRFRLCSGHTLVELDNTIYAIGGTNDKSILSDIEALDVHGGTEVAEWTLELGMPSPRTEHAAAVVVGRIWVCGGFDGDEILRCEPLLLVMGKPCTIS
jgi:hypothetical protein